MGLEPVLLQEAWCSSAEGRTKKIGRMHLEDEVRWCRYTTPSGIRQKGPEDKFEDEAYRNFNMK